jgi:hypothetical protein
MQYLRAKLQDVALHIAHSLEGDKDDYLLPVRSIRDRTDAQVRKTGGGAIVNTSSIFGLMATPGGSEEPGMETAEKSDRTGIRGWIFALGKVVGT